MGVAHWIPDRILVTWLHTDYLVAYCLSGHLVLSLGLLLGLSQGRCRGRIPLGSMVGFEKGGGG